MTSEKKSNMNNEDRSNSSNKFGGKKDQNPYKKQQDSHGESKQGSGQPKSDQRTRDAKEDVGDERHLDQQVTRPKEHQKDDQNFNDRSSRT